MLNKIAESSEKLVLFLDFVLRQKFFSERDLVIFLAEYYIVFCSLIRLRRTGEAGFASISFVLSSFTILLSYKMRNLKRLDDLIFFLL